MYKECIIIGIILLIVGTNMLMYVKTSDTRRDHRRRERKLAMALAKRRRRFYDEFLWSRGERETVA